MLGPSIRARAAALVVAAFACAAAQPAPGQVITPDVVPDALWWRTGEPARLDTDPLAALGCAHTLAIRAEWAPLYAGPDGTRFEREQRSFSATSPGVRWRAGAEVGSERGAARGGDRPWWLDAERPIATSGAVGVFASGVRYRAAASVSAQDGAVGIAAALEAQLAATARASVTLSRVPRSGRATFRLSDDIDVLASGRWIERRSRWALTLGSDDASVGFALHTLDRGPDARAPSSEDGLESTLSWRAFTARADAEVRGAELALTADYGEGHEAVRFRRGNTPYADGGGPVTNAALALSIGGRDAPYHARAWLGRWRGDAHAVVALWPFDALGAAAGSRQVATSNGALRHGGVSFDRLVRNGSGIEAGLALWRLVPEASYQSWRTTLLGIGRSDASAGAVEVQSLVAAGLRLGAVATWSDVRVRIEAVQWVPFAVQRASSPDGGSQTGGTGEPGVAGVSGRERGGTVVRFSIEL